MNLLQLGQKNFPHIQKVYFNVLFFAESIGTLIFDVRARYLKSTFQKISGHTLFYILKYKVSKKVDFA